MCGRREAKATVNLRTLPNAWFEKSDSREPPCHVVRGIGTIVGASGFVVPRGVRLRMHPNLVFDDAA